MKNRILGLANSLLHPFGLHCLPKGEYERAAQLSMTAMLQRLAQRNIPIKTIVDLGASDGKWSIACMEYFPEASYLAVEPLEERREALENKKRRFGNFNYALCAAGEKDEKEVNIHVASDLDGSTINGKGRGVSRKCCLRTVDSLANEKNLSGQYLLKFDTHGYELPILSESKKVLMATEAIIMEVYNFQLTENSLRFHEMCAHLEGLGFRPADIADPLFRLYDNAFWQIDILFLKTTSDIFKYQDYK